MHPNETVVVLLDAILLEAQSPAVVGGGKAFATEFADRNICILGENRHRVGSDAHLTSENGKLAAFAP